MWGEVEYKPIHWINYINYSGDIHKVHIDLSKKKLVPAGVHIRTLQVSFERRDMPETGKFFLVGVFGM